MPTFRIPFVGFALVLPQVFGVLVIYLIDLSSLRPLIHQMCCSLQIELFCFLRRLLNVYVASECIFPLSHCFPDFFLSFREGGRYQTGLLAWCLLQFVGLVCVRDFHLIP